MIELIKQKINPYLASKNLVLSSCKIKKDYGLNHIIEIIIKGKNYYLEPEQIHYDILDLIDDLMPEDYYLEVSGIGAEYPLDNIEEIKEHINSYVFINSPEYNGYGYISDVNNNEISLKINLKGRIKTIIIVYNELIKIRTAVKV